MIASHRLQPYLEFTSSPLIIDQSTPNVIFITGPSLSGKTSLAHCLLSSSVNFAENTILSFESVAKAFQYFTSPFDAFIDDISPSSPLVSQLAGFIQQMIDTKASFVLVITSSYSYE